MTYRFYVIGIDQRSHPILNGTMTDNYKSRPNETYEVYSLQTWMPARCFDNTIEITPRRKT